MSSSVTGGNLRNTGTYSLAPAIGLPAASVTLPVTTSFSPAGFGTSLAGASGGASFFGDDFSGAFEAAMRPPTAIRRPAARAAAGRMNRYMGVTPLARAETAGRTEPGPANDNTESTSAG